MANRLASAAANGDMNVSMVPIHNITTGIYLQFIFYDLIVVV